MHTNRSTSGISRFESTSTQSPSICMSMLFVFIMFAITLYLSMPQAALFFLQNSTTRSINRQAHIHPITHWQVLLRTTIRTIQTHYQCTSQSFRISTRFNFHLLHPFSIDNGVSHVASQEAKSVRTTLVDRARGRWSLWYEGFFKFAFFHWYFPRCLFEGEIRIDYFCGLCPWVFMVFGEFVFLLFSFV